MHNTDQPSGPKDLDGILSWHADIFSRLQDIDDTVESSLLNEILKSFKHGVVLTPSYSGLGGADIVASMLCEQAQRLVESQGSSPSSTFKGLRCHAACDIASGPRRVLREHPMESRPEHVFNNILDRLFPADRIKCEGTLRKKLGKYRLAEAREERRTCV